MSDNSGGNGGLYFIVGGLAVIAVIGIFLFTNGSLGGHHSSSTTTIERTVTPNSSSTTLEKK
jgi:hypothetical protein